jgi:hypothetical protein
MQKGKEGTLSEKDMENIFNIVETEWKTMFPKIKEMVFP